MRPTGIPVQKVRTFADDVRRAQGGEVPQPADVRTSVPEVRPSMTPTPTGLEHELFDVTAAATGVAEPTIVREGRGDHWSLGDALQDSLSSWFGGKVKKLTTKKASPQVAPAIERASIIRVATREKAMAPQDDHTALVEKLRTYAANPHEELSLKPAPPAIPEASWSHIESAPSPAQALPKTATPPVQPPALATLPTKIRVSTPLPAVPRVPSRSEFTPLEPLDTQEPVSVPIQNNVATQTVVEESQNDVVGYANASIDNSSTPRVRITRTVEEVIPQGAPEKSFTERARERALQIREADDQHFSFVAYLPSKLLLYIGAGVFVLFTLAGIGSMGYLALTRSSSETPSFIPQKNSSLVSNVTSRDALPLGQNRNAFLIELTKRIREAGGELGQFKEFYFVFPNDKTEQELPAEAFLNTLEANAPGSLVRTITRMAFGVRIAGSNAPFLIFQVRDQDEALGGMLAWEQYINGDFAPLFGEDQELIGATQRPFMDTTVSGTDARILRDQNGATLFIYTRVNDLIIMSTSEETIRALIQQ